MTNDNYDNVFFEDGEDIIFITLNKYKFFMANGKLGRDAKDLYEHYMFTGKIQKTNTVHAVNNFCGSGLTMSKERIVEAKKFLIDSGLIEIVTKRDDLGKITGHYVKVMCSTNPIARGWKNQTVDNPEGGKTETNSYTNNINSYTNNVNAIANKESASLSACADEEKKTQDCCKNIDSITNNNFDLIPYMYKRIEEEHNKYTPQDPYIRNEDFFIRKLFEQVNKETFDGKLNALINKNKNIKDEKLKLTISARTLLNKLNDLQIAVEPPKVNNRYKSGNVKTPIKSMTLREQILSTPGLAEKYCLADVIEDEIEKGIRDADGELIDGVEVKELECYKEC
mgnify:FL=1